MFYCSLTKKRMALGRIKKGKGDSTARTVSRTYTTPMEMDILYTGTKKQNVVIAPNYYFITYLWGFCFLSCPTAGGCLSLGTCEAYPGPAHFH